MSGNATRVYAKEFSKILIPSITATFVIQRMNFHEKHFLYEGKLIRKPNILWNPDALKITGRYLHV